MWDAETETPWCAFYTVTLIGGCLFLIWDTEAQRLGARFTRWHRGALARAWGKEAQNAPERVLHDDIARRYRERGI